ncbi:hypothetical protein [Micromonospora sp. CPCC 205561]|uniref:hypothetical protein n=1 Tax=Micromonospora sp. CPCC 205561 TaxID=3122407 RepID=UPI002FEFF9A1
MRELGYVATAVAFEMPTVVVLLVGLVLTATAGRRLPRGPRLLALSGLGVLLASAVLSAAWTLLLHRVYGSDWGRSNFHLVNLAYSGVLALAYPLGTGLLIAALLGGRRAGGADAGPSGGGSFGGGAPMPSAQPTPSTQPAPWDGRSRPDAPAETGPERP